MTSIITEKDAGVHVPSIIPGGNVIPFSNVGNIRNAIFQNEKGTNITGRRAEIFIQRLRFDGSISMFAKAMFIPFTRTNSKFLQISFEEQMFINDEGCRVVHPRVPGKISANKVFCDIVLCHTNMYKNPRMVVGVHVRDDVLGKAQARIFTIKPMKHAQAA